MSTKPTTFVSVFPDDAGEWRWHIVRGGRIVADGSEGYVRRSSAKRAVLRFVAGFDRSVVLVECDDGSLAGSVQ